MEMENKAASARFHQPHMERKMSAMTCEIFNELRLEGKLCDVVIKVNGFEFNAHKNILCSCSSYFRYNRGAGLSLRGDWVHFRRGSFHVSHPTVLSLGTLSKHGAPVGSLAPLSSEGAQIGPDSLLSDFQLDFNQCLVGQLLLPFDSHSNQPLGKLSIHTGFPT